MLRKTSFLSLICSASLLAIVGCSRGGGSIDKTIEEGKPLVRVGDEKIHEGYLLLLQRVNPGLKAQLDNPQGKKRIVDNLIEQELLYQESLNRGIDKKPDVQEKADLYKRAIIAQALLDDELDKKAKEYYEQNKNTEFERVKIAHIFFSSSPKMTPPAPGKLPTVPSEEEKKKAEDDAAARAKAAYDRLKKGENWEAVTKEVSEDKSSSERAGEFGYLTKADRRIDRLEYKALVDAAFNLPKGQFSEPIKAKDGWHIVEVMEEKQVQPYEDVALGIKTKSRMETKAALIGELKKKEKIQYLDTSLADAPPPAVPESMPMAQIPESKMAPGSMPAK